jgi:hypothetical protein
MISLVVENSYPPCFRSAEQLTAVNDSAEGKLLTGDRYKEKREDRG